LLAAGKSTADILICRSIIQERIGHANYKTRSAGWVDIQRNLSIFHQPACIKHNIPIGGKYHSSFFSLLSVKQYSPLPSLTGR
jgi:hypothetical protein